MSTQSNSSFIKTTAAALGFEFCGIAKAEYLEEDAMRLEQWLASGMHGKMSYMENHFDLRVDPTKLVPGAKSVISLLYNYYPCELQDEEAPKVAKYAYGEDYHLFIRKKLNLFFETIQSKIGEVHGRGFVDSAPILERSWAQKSGLGWIGKNGNLLNRKMGSFFFIASLVIDLPLEYDIKYNHDYCGTCTKCIDACPTDAILPNKIVNGSKCISYYTIELKDLLIPQEAKGKMNDWIFGCDICQDVCPWNRFSQPKISNDMTPISAVLNFTTKDWEDLTEESFEEIFKNSPIKRTKYAGIKRNLKFSFLQG